MLSMWSGFCIAALKHFSFPPIDFSLQPFRSHLFTHIRVCCPFLVEISKYCAVCREQAGTDRLCSVLLELLLIHGMRNLPWRYRMPASLSFPDPSPSDRTLFRGTPCHVSHLKVPTTIPSIQDSIVKVLFCKLRCTPYLLLCVVFCLTV